MTEGPIRLEVTNAVVVRGARRIVRDVTLPPIATGEVTAFVGPNGAGKSTLLKAIAQVLPSTGEFRFGTHDLARMPRAERSRLVGYMPQAIPADTELTAIDSVLVALGGGRDATPRRAMAVLDRLGMTDLALVPLDRLSGGQRQLVSLAQAVANGPRLLLLDEPTSALDLARQYQTMRHLRGLAGEGAAVVVVLHDLSLAAQWADRIVVLKGGVLHSAGEPDAVLTPQMLAEVYGLRARVERSGDHLRVVAEGLTAELQSSFSGA